MGVNGEYTINCVSMCLPLVYHPRCIRSLSIVCCRRSTRGSTISYLTLPREDLAGLKLCLILLMLGFDGDQCSCNLCFLGSCSYCGPCLWVCGSCCKRSWCCACKRTKLFEKTNWVVSTKRSVRLFDLFINFARLTCHCSLPNIGVPLQNTPVHESNPLSRRSLNSTR